jgi:hypothetical protein
VVALEHVGGDPFPTSARFFAGVDLHSASVVLPLLAEDTGMTPSRLRFQYRVTRSAGLDRGDGTVRPIDVAPSEGDWIPFDGRAGLPWPAEPQARLEGGAEATVDPTPSAADRGLLVLAMGNPPGAGDAYILRADGAGGTAYLPALGVPSSPSMADHVHPEEPEP